MENEAKVNEAKTIEQLGNEVVEFLKKYLDKVGTDGHKVVGSTGFGLSQTSPEGVVTTRPYSIIFVQGGPEKLKLLANPIGALADLDDSIEQMSPEDKNAYVTSYIRKINEVTIPAEAVATDVALEPEVINKA